MKKVLIVGAGKLGKGFIGEVFDAAENWQVAFLDTDPKVIDVLNRPQGYTVFCHCSDCTIKRHITNYTAFLEDDTFACEDYVLDCDLIMMPLYPYDFDAACAYLGKLLSKRSEVNPSKPLDIVSVTNYNHYMNHIRETFISSLVSESARKWFSENVYLSDSIIRRGTIATSNYDPELRSRVVASLLIQTPIHCDLSDVPWMELRDNIELLKDMKLYTINGTHATTAYFGYLKGYELVDDSSKDPEIQALVKEVRAEAVVGLTHAFPLTKEEIEDMCAPTMQPLFEPLRDSTLRVCWDPQRKVALQDRLTGNALFCYNAGQMPYALLTSIANCLAYDEPRDPKAVEMQEYIKANGIEKAVPHFTGLPEDHPMVPIIIENYKKISKN